MSNNHLQLTMPKKEPLLPTCSFYIIPSSEDDRFLTAKNLRIILSFSLMPNVSLNHVSLILSIHWASIYFRHHLGISISWYHSSGLLASLQIFKLPLCSSVTLQMILLRMKANYIIPLIKTHSGVHMLFQILRKLKQEDHLSSRI